DAHEAIRPTSVLRHPDEIKDSLDEDQAALYALIWRRFLASQMAAAVYDVTTVDIAAEPYGLRAVGSVIKFPGFLEVYEEEKEDDASDEADEEGRLPVLHPEEALRLLELLPQQHFTKPPPRYSEASLVKALEENGIGRPSTYAQIIDVLRQRDYVRMRNKRFVPTPLGFVVRDFLVENFPDLMDVKFTAQMEEGLDTIERGAQDWVALMRQYYDRLVADLEAARNAGPKRLGEKCPECGGELLQLMNARGKFAGCEKYPECKYTRPIEEPALALQAPETLEEECPECGKPLRIRQGGRGRFVGCSGYPECQFTRPVSDRGESREPPKETDVVCEACGAKMLLRDGKRGKFLGCSNYPKCRNTKDVDEEGNVVESSSGEAAPAGDGDSSAAETCDKCGRPMVERRGRRGRFLGCSGYPKCRNTRPLPRSEATKSSAAAAATDRECPECGRAMVVRSGRRGDFLGCSGYPKCRHTEDLVAEPPSESDGD
ncbi:MAG: topoisomerase DNA-binding C4 zinc finger domain-containing protein, partial [Armatimonadota bacterium]